MANQPQALTMEQLEWFRLEGFLLVQGLFKEAEVLEIEAAFERISGQFIPGHFEPDLHAATVDPLARFPRVMHPHRFNETAMKYMLHEPVLQVLEDLYGEPPLAAQSMYYYKPPGSRGQALHQDNFYLKVEPGNCIAAWTAIDPADQDNGGLLVVPKTNDYAIVCPELADARESFTTHFVKPPKQEKAMPVTMNRGDVLFFNGNLIHGSYRNRTRDRFRRAFICHYANSSAHKIAEYYRPLYRANGTPVQLANNPNGGPCGDEFKVDYPH